MEMLWQCALWLRIAIASRVLDVGCAYGATGIFLASECGCHVDGPNLSPRQLKVTSKKVNAARLGAKVHLHLQDAESFAYPADHYDVVWTMESSEHFVDKPNYFHQVRRTLRQHGRVLLAAWTGSMSRASVRSVAKHFLCSEICTGDEYLESVETAGLRVYQLINASQHVMPTWPICLGRVKRLGALKQLLPREARSFAEGLECILDAYGSGDLTYTIIAAQQP